MPAERRGHSRWRTRLLILLQILPAASVCTASACPAGLRHQQESAVEAGSHAAAPDGWIFSDRHVVATYGADGMVSATDRIASEIGAAVLRRGGNAVDGAIATYFALAVINPEAGNIGGGGFLIARVAGRAVALDFRETAPLAASRDMFLDAHGQLTDRSRIGHLAAGVPGSVAGMWEAHRRFGSLPWAELVRPAVNLAEGTVVQARLADSLQAHEEELRRFPATAAAFLLDGRAPHVGERLVQHDLADALRRIARDGRDGFYLGHTAALVDAEMRRGGGIMTREDLASYTAVWREPIVFRYRDHTVISMPPPSSGGATLAEILNILEHDNVQALGYLSPDHVHLWTEAVKRAFVDRNTYLADPDFVAQPTERMTSDAYATLRRREIRMDRATPSAEVHPGMGRTRSGERMTARREGDHTTHYSIVDREGNAVAVTTTLNSLFGGLVTVPGAGFLLNNEMDDFAAKPGTANQFGLVQGESNAIAPAKRMLSAMSPTILLAPSGQVRLVTGTPGGPTIITTTAQIISNVVDFHMGIDLATTAPRLHHQHLPDILYYERHGLRSGVESRIRSLGHAVEMRSGYQGETHSILVRPDGTLVGVADPRRGGAAVSVRDVSSGQ